LEKPEPESEPELIPSERPAIHELVAYETSDAEEMGFKDEVIDEDKLPISLEPEEPQEPPPAEGRYVPRSSTKSEAKFIRREGVGPKADD